MKIIKSKSELPEIGNCIYLFFLMDFQEDILGMDTELRGKIDGLDLAILVNNQDSIIMQLNSELLDFLKSIIEDRTIIKVIGGARVLPIITSKYGFIWRNFVDLDFLFLLFGIERGIRDFRIRGLLTPEQFFTFYLTKAKAEWNFYLFLQQISHLFNLKFIKLSELLRDVQQIFYLMSVNGIKVNTIFLENLIQKKDLLPDFAKKILENFIQFIKNDRIYFTCDFETASLRATTRNFNVQGLPQSVVLQNGEIVNFRNLLCAEDGYDLVSCDFDQLEVRIIAHLSQDKNLLNFFKQNKDFHLETAKFLFRVQEDDKDINIFRQKAKRINFAMFYGMGAKKLATELQIAETEAEQLIENWKILYRGVEILKEFVYNKYQKDGFIINLFDMPTSFMDGITKNEIFNWVIQSSGSILSHLSLRRIYFECLQRDWDAMPVLDLHDGFVFEVNKGYTKDFVKLLKQIFEDWDLTVPITVKIKVNEV